MCYGIKHITSVLATTRKGDVTQFTGHNVS